MQQWHQQNRELGDCVMQLARGAISSKLNNEVSTIGDDNVHEMLNSEGACFVRLRINGQLRGENGAPQSNQFLPKSIRQNAYQAAFNDPRFKPLKSQELDDLALEVSLVSPLEAIFANSVTELGDKITPMEDGLHVVTDYGSFSLFPDTWAAHANTRMFITQLMRKAHIDPNMWHDDYMWYRFQTLTFKENPVH